MVMKRKSLYLHAFETRLDKPCLRRKVVLRSSRWSIFKPVIGEAGRGYVTCATAKKSDSAAVCDVCHCYGGTPAFCALSVFSLIRVVGAFFNLDTNRRFNLDGSIARQQWTDRVGLGIIHYHRRTILHARLLVHTCAITEHALTAKFS